MKTISFIIFFSIVFVILTALNYYIVRRFLQAVPYDSPYRMYIVWLMVFLALSFVGGRILENVSINFISTALIWIGAFYLSVMVYLFLQLVFIDLFRLIDHWFGIFPAFIKNNPVKSKLITAYVVAGIALLVSIAGHINTRFPAIRNYELTINKEAGNLKELNIVTVSDIHLGTIIGRDYLSKVINKIEALNPDIILIPGDIIDEDIAPVLHNGIGDVLRKINAPYGVYAVTGNHEYIGGVEAAKKFLGEHNIHLLNDESVLIDSSFYIAGREDLSINQFSDGRRKPLEEIVNNVDKSLPLILLDHQPFKLENAVKNSVDLQLSGHTHHGQLWPFNFITEMVYELSWGYKKKGETHFYVSCGVGGWGPPVRTVSRPEIVKIKLIFSGKKSTRTQNYKGKST